MKTITRSELGRAQFCNNPPDIVQDWQGYHQWVGIGWIDAEPPFKTTPMRVIDDVVALPDRYKKGSIILYKDRIIEILSYRRNYRGWYIFRYEDTGNTTTAKLQD